MAYTEGMTTYDVTACWLACLRVRAQERESDVARDPAISAAVSALAESRDKSIARLAQRTWALIAAVPEPVKPVSQTARKPKVARKRVKCG